MVKTELSHEHERKLVSMVVGCSFSNSDDRTIGIVDESSYLYPRAAFMSLYFSTNFRVDILYKLVEENLRKAIFRTVLRFFSKTCLSFNLITFFHHFEL